MTDRPQSQPALVLASASPRRAALLRRVGVDFEVHAMDVDESLIAGEAPAAAAVRLARDKARAGARRWPACAILAADTMVSAGGKGLGKPGSRQQAREMLRELSGSWHEVTSGVALAMPGDEGEVAAASSTSRVLFSRLTRAEIEAYTAGDEPWDKAGAYAIQGAAAWFIERVEGSPSNVVGLPLEAVRHLFFEAGLPLPSLRGVSR